MRARASVCNVWLVTTSLTIALPFGAVAADLHSHHSSSHHEASTNHFASPSHGYMTSFRGASMMRASYSHSVGHGFYGHVAASGYRSMVMHGRYRFFGASSGYVARGGGGIQCVTFARAATGIELSGNAADWWDNAAGLYQRGQHPEIGSVLNFRANGRMRMGHVAVVTAVLNSRTVEIDHANWSGPGAVRGGVSRAINVVDVSSANDWSAVRVELGHGEEFGSVYPTFGFIYNRPDGSPAPARTLMASAPVPAMNPPPADLSPAGERVAGPLTRTRFDEVAEAPAPRQLELNFGPNPASTAR